MALNDSTSGYVSLQSFKFWCQKILPLVYDDSLSYYEVLCKLVDYLNQMIANEESLKDTTDEHAKSIQNLQTIVNTLQTELDKAKNGEYSELYQDALTNWLDNNMPELIGRTVKYVHFGLTDSGYFCAYIPNSWDFLTLDTIMDYKSDLYGHLVMRY